MEWENNNSGLKIKVVSPEINTDIISQACASYLGASVPKPIMELNCPSFFFFLLFFLSYYLLKTKENLTPDSVSCPVTQLEMVLLMLSKPEKKTKWRCSQTLSHDQGRMWILGDLFRPYMALKSRTASTSF